MDKVGRSLGLPFPAGRFIDELSQKYDPEIHKNIPNFTTHLAVDGLDFSFSGLKSAALREIEARKKDHGELTETDHIEISYGYQKTIMTVLSERLIKAHKKLKTKSLALVGGVSANSTLQKIMKEYSENNHIPYYTPKSLKYC